MCRVTIFYLTYIFSSLVEESRIGRDWRQSAWEDILDTMLDEAKNKPTVA